MPARYIPEVIVRFQLELEGCQLGASWVPARCIPDAIVRCQLGASQIHPNSYSQGCQLGASQMHPKGYSQELYRCQLGARHMHPRSYYYGASWVPARYIPYIRAFLFQGASWPLVPATYPLLGIGVYLF